MSPRTLEIQVQEQQKTVAFQKGQIKELEDLLEIEVINSNKLRQEALEYRMNKLQFDMKLHTAKIAINNLSEILSQPFLTEKERMKDKCPECITNGFKCVKCVERYEEHRDNGCSW